MRLNYIRTGLLMTAKELLRNRIALILFLLIPSLFNTLIVLTTRDRPITLYLASISEETFFKVSERSETLVFIALAAAGFIAAFLGLNLIQKHIGVDRRLVLCGYCPSELISAKLILLLFVILLIGGYGTSSLLFFFQPRHFFQVILGFILGGYIYGCYGLLVGAIFKRELEDILCIVLLGNIDVGWLQNPLYYSESRSKAIIRALPAFFPSQMTMVAAFTDHSVSQLFMGGIVYGGILLVTSLLIYWWRMKIKK